MSMPGKWVRPAAALPAGRPYPARSWSVWAIATGALTAAVLVGLSVGAGGWNWPLIRELRLPRVLAGAGAGALLAEAGLALQLVLRNPLADPYVLGASAGAGLGAILALALVGELMWLGSMIGALVALIMLIALGRRMLASIHDSASARLILIGAMISAVFAAISAMLLSLLPDQSVRGAVFWSLGDLSGARYGAQMCGLAALLACPLRAFSRSLDRLTLGIRHAWLLGEPVERIRFALVLLAAVATGVSVAQAGAIGFVGLVVPQALRMLGVVRMRELAVATPLAGAAVLVLADAVARGVVSPIELPVGAIMAIIGAPFFVLLLVRRVR